jgi:hypothetical protein
MEPDLLISFGGAALKSISVEGNLARVGGPMVQFLDRKDLDGDRFTAKTYLGRSDGNGQDVLFDHGIPVKSGAAFMKYADHIFSHQLETKRRDLDIWAETVLDMADEYEAYVYKMVEAGKLGWSSGAAGHRVKRAPDGTLIRWPVDECSFTPVPCEPENRFGGGAIMPVKSWLGMRDQAYQLQGFYEINTEAKGVRSVSNYPIAPKGTAWSKSAADKRWRAYTKATDEPNSDYAKGFLWVDYTAPDNFGSYKFPYVDVIDGKPAIVPKAIFAIAGILNGAMGGTKIPEADQDSMKDKVSAVYKKIASANKDDSIVAPWDKKDDKPKKSMAPDPAGDYTLTDTGSFQEAWEQRYCTPYALTDVLCSQIYSLEYQDQMADMNGIVFDLRGNVMSLLAGFCTAVLSAVCEEDAEQDAEDGTSNPDANSAKSWIKRIQDFKAAAASAPTIVARSNAVASAAAEFVKSASVIVECTEQLLDDWQAKAAMRAKSGRMLSQPNVDTLKQHQDAVGDAIEKLSQVKAGIGDLIAKAGIPPKPTVDPDAANRPAEPPDNQKTAAALRVLQLDLLRSEEIALGV